MKMRLFLLIIFFFSTVAGVSAQVNAKKKSPTSKTQTIKKHRVVYDFSQAADTALQAALIRQLNNIKKGWPDAQIEVVVHGKGLDLLLSQKAYSGSGIKALQDKGLVFAACENTMRFRKVSKADLLPGVITVPMGVGEIVMKQEEGWSLIKY